MIIEIERKASLALVSAEINRTHAASAATGLSKTANNLQENAPSADARIG